MKLIRWKVVFSLIISIILSLVCTIQVDAMDKTSIKSKAALEGIYQCSIQKSVYKFDWELTKDKENNGSGLLFLNTNVFGGVWADGNLVKLPYGFTDATNDNDTDCVQIMKGFGEKYNISGDELNKGFIPKNIQDGSIETVKNFFVSIGYEATKKGGGSNSEGETLIYEIDTAKTDCRTQDDRSIAQEIKIIRENDGANIGTRVRFPTITYDEGKKSYIASSENIDVPAPGSLETFFYSVCGKTFWIMDVGSSARVDYEMSFSGGSSPDNKETVSNKGYDKKEKNITLIDTAHPNGTVVFSKSVPKTTINNVEDYNEYDMHLSDTRQLDRTMRLVKGLNENNQIGYKVSGLKDYNGLALKPQEVYDLYTYYLRDLYKVPVICEGDSNWKAYDDSKYGDINWSKSKKCKYDLDTSSVTTPPKKVYGVDDNYHFTKELSGPEDVINMLNKLPLDDVATLDSGNLDEVTNPSDDEEGDEGYIEHVVKTCRNQKGAEHLGWILCSILDIVGHSTEDLYNTVVEPLLVIDTNLFSSDGKSANSIPSEAWKTFRDIANVVFVILLLIVIFSQLTGIGIDNYGIKKILPKLIVAAILINLSYVICLVVIDVSNILGNGFQELFNNLGSGIAENVTLTDEGIDSGTAVLSTVGNVASVGILAGLGAVTGTIWATPMIVLSLLVSAIGVLISVLFLFFLLSVRQAAIIVLVVLSPVAIVCYILPNTKGLFDKWMNLFKALLLVYPIAGLLIGGGNYVSKLILASGSGSFGLALTAMIAGIVPIFFLPNVVKSAFKMMGNLGATISGIGNKVGGGLSKATRNSQPYKTAQEGLNKWATEKRAGVGKKYALDDSAYGKFRRGMLGGTRGVARDVAAVKKAEADEVENYMTFINDRTRNGEDITALDGIFDQFMKSGNKSGAVAAARIAGRRSDTAFDFMNKAVANASNMDSNMFRSIAKEMTTGENAANYRASSPIKFEYMSQVNKESAESPVSRNYGEWSSNQDNINSAVKHHITDTKSIVSMKSGSMEELGDLMDEGKMDSKQIERIRGLAGETIDNRGTTGIWDSTKAEHIQWMAGRGPRPVEENGNPNPPSTSNPTPNGPVPTIS